MLEIIFDDFLRFTFPDADQRFDMGKGFTYLDKELSELLPHPEEVSDTKFVDKLVKVYTRNGKEKYLLVHVEVQGHYDKTFTARMFKYFYRVYDKYDRAILPVAIFTGEGGKRMGNRFHLQDDGMELTYEFNTLDIKDFTDVELSASDNPFTGALRVAQGLSISGLGRNEQLLKAKIELARDLYGKGFNREKMEGILGFIDNYVLFDKPEYSHIFKEQLDVLTGKTNTMDIFEQIAEIRAEEARKAAEQAGDKKAVKLLLSNTELSVDKIAELVGVPVSFAKKVRDSLHVKAQR